MSTSVKDQKRQSYQVVFLNVTRDGVDHAQALAQLQRKASLAKGQVYQLLQQAPCTIKTFKTPQGAKDCIKLLWRLGWHTSLYRNGDLCYSTRKDRCVKASKRTISAAEQESMAFPSGWQLMTGLNSHASLQVGSTQGRRYCVSIAQKKSDFASVPDLTFYAKTTVNNAFTRMPSVFINNFCQLAEIPAIRQKVYLSEFSVGSKRASDAKEVSHVGDTRDITYLVAVLEGKQKFYSLYFWCPANDYLEVKPQFLEILESFRLSYDRKLETA